MLSGRNLRHQLLLTRFSKGFSDFLFRWGRKIVLVGVFAIFPIFIFQASLFQIEKLETGRLMQNQRSKQTQLLTRLKAADSEAVFLTRNIERTFREALALPQNEAYSRLSRILKRFPKMVEIFFFDRNGKIIPAISSRASGRKPFETVFEGLLSLKNGRKLTSSQDGFIRKIFNTTYPKRLERAMGKAVYLGNRDLIGFALWKHEENENPAGISGYFAYFHPKFFQKGSAIKATLNWVNGQLKNYSAAVVENRDGKMSFYPRRIARKPGFLNTVRTTLEQFEQHFTTSDSHGTLALRANAGYLMVFSPKPRFFSPGFTWFFHGLCLAWILIVIRFLPDQSRGVAARIPVKLIALFLFAVGTPSFLLLVGGYYALKDKTNILMQEVETKVREKIRRLDERFPLEVKRVEQFLHKIIVRARKADSPEERKGIYEEFLKEKSLDTVIIMNQKGQEIFNFPRFKRMMASDSAQKEKGKMVLLLGRELIKRINNSTEIDSGTMAMEVTSGVLNSLMGANGEFNIDLVLENQGKFQTFTFGQDSALMYVEFITNREGMAEEAAIGYLTGHHFEGNYIQRLLPVVQKETDLQWRINASAEVWRTEGRQTTALYRNTILSQESDRAMVEKMFDDVNTAREPVRKIVETHGREELWVGTRCQNFLRYIVVGVTSLEPVKDYIKLLWLLLLAVATLFFLSTAVIGFTLAEQFLTPINDLNLGIRAIEKRNFRHKIPVHAKDELGEMAELMNNVVEGMGDLEIARVVQENLFPQKELVIGEYTIFGVSRTMTDVGGDYYDYFQVGDNRLEGLIGDVSGHGVSAALIMGMAKCAFTMDEFLAGNLLDGLKRFNQFMVKTVKKKKMMTMFRYSLNTDTHVLQFSNAGHNYPFHWKAATSTIGMLELDFFPMGIRVRDAFPIKETEIGPGDVILLYTDGLVEAQNKAGEVVDYEKAQTWLSEVAHLEPRAAVAEMFRLFQDYTAGMKPADDVSIICLKRNPGPAAQPKG